MGGWRSEIAAALDGCFAVTDAALVEPYTHDPSNRGILFYQDGPVIEFAKAAQQAPFLGEGSLSKGPWRENRILRR